MNEQIVEAAYDPYGDLEDAGGIAGSMTLVERFCAEGHTGTVCLTDQENRCLCLVGVELPDKGD